MIIKIIKKNLPGFVIIRNRLNIYMYKRKTSNGSLSELKSELSSK